MAKVEEVGVPIGDLNLAIKWLSRVSPDYGLAGLVARLKGYKKVRIPNPNKAGKP